MPETTKRLFTDDNFTPASVRELVSSLEHKDHLLVEQKQQLDKKDQEIEQLLTMVHLLRQKRFGRSSEAFNPDQLQIFDETQLDELLKQEEPEEGRVIAITTEDKPKKKPRRRPLPAAYQRIEHIIDLPDEEKATMGNDWVFIGYDSGEQLSVIPRQHYVLVIKRAKYAPVNESVKGAEQGIRTASRPDQIIPKSIAHSSVIADAIANKFIDGLPFYRQAKRYQAEGVELSRQTMSGWTVQLITPLTPLMKLLKQLLYEGPIMHLDETRFQVLGEANRENIQKSYMYVYKGGPPDKPVVWYDYADNKGSQVPVDFLFPSDEKVPESTSMVLVTDDYSGFNALAAHPAIKGHAGCWAHTRRKYHEASLGRNKSASAFQMLGLIGKLYQIERQIKDEPAEQKQSTRQQQAKPILDQIRKWLDKQIPRVTPKSDLGKAIRYTDKLWDKLTLYITDGYIPIDNNPAENAIRPFVIGRKNWLHSGSPRGAKASAMIYTLIETAKANQLEPRHYLEQLFEHLPKAKTEAALIELLPQNFKTSDLNG
ncbi:MAG: IS66 family transposase [Gammaproteobacteria bacterium]|nr:IS66 family transposase [Gammaproteobacteria bacterium]